MDMAQVLEDLAFIADRVHVSPGDVVAKWSDVHCDDPQASVAVVLAFVANYIEGRPHSFAVEDSPYILAASDILLKSRLGSLLELDSADREIRYRDTVPHETREELAEFAGKRRPGFH